MTFTIPFTLSFTIYGLPGYNSIFPSEIEANRGGGSPHFGRYKKCKNFIATITIKNDNDTDIQVRISTKWVLPRISSKCVLKISQFARCNIQFRRKINTSIQFHIYDHLSTRRILQLYGPFVVALWQQSKTDVRSDPKGLSHSVCQVPALTCTDSRVYSRRRMDSQYAYQHLAYQQARYHPDVKPNLAIRRNLSKAL